MCPEYPPDELLAILRKDGPRLLEQFFVPEPDTDALIKQSVAGNSFRGFSGMQPAEAYRGWARGAMSFGAVADLGEVTAQEQYDALLDRRCRDLTKFWLAKTGKELGYGPVRKLVNSLHKFMVRDVGVSAAGRERVIPLLHVPHDKHCLAAVRLSAASGQYGAPLAITPSSPAGFVVAVAQYDAFQGLLRGIAAAAGVPPICVDLLAWDWAHEAE